MGFIDKGYITIYSYIMTKKEKLLEKAKKNPHGLSINDFCTLMSNQGWKLDHQRGSHQIWYSPLASRVCVQNRAGKAKGYQVKQFLDALEKEGNNNA